MADTLQVNGNGRPSNVKHPSAPSLMMNSHFASVGENASKEDYEHGIQVIDEAKVFKCVSILLLSATGHLLIRRILVSTSAPTFLSRG